MQACLQYVKGSFWSSSIELIEYIFINLLYPSYKEMNMPIHDAACSGIYAALLNLITEDPSSVNLKNVNDYTPLHCAAKFGHDDCVQLLLEVGSSIDARNNVGDTPLHCAASNGHYKVVATLLKYNPGVNLKDKLGNSPLHIAAKYGYTESVNRLLEAGADKTNENNAGNTPLELASGELKIVIDEYQELPTVKPACNM